MLGGREGSAVALDARQPSLWTSVVDRGWLVAVRPRPMCSGSWPDRSGHEGCVAPGELATCVTAGALGMNRNAPSCTSTDLPARAAAEPVCFACFFLLLAAAPPLRLLANIASLLRLYEPGGKSLGTFGKRNLGTT